MVARDNSVTDAEKTALVQRFSGQVTRLVYSLASDLDIIINVPLTPDVVDAVKTVAKKTRPFESSLDRDDDRQRAPAAKPRSALAD
jgi:hypothetical protein